MLWSVLKLNLFNIYFTLLLTGMESGVGLGGVAGDERGGWGWGRNDCRVI